MVSYVYDDHKWGDAQFGTPGGVVTWSFAAANYPGQAFSFDARLGGDYATEVRAAFDRWESVANIDFVEVADNASSMIRLGFDYIDGRGRVVGEANTEYTQAGSNIDAEIRFETDESWHLANGRVIDGGGDLFYVIALHEIGHTLGFGHDNDGASVMNSVASPSITDLLPIDIEGIRAIYGPAGGTFTVPAVTTTPAPSPPAAPADPAPTPSAPTVVPGIGGLVVHGSLAGELMDGSARDDSLFGEGGDDTVNGGEGNDRLEGNDGDDELHGGHGNDWLFGGNGNDRLFGGTGNDRLEGNDGNDELSGEDGNDVLSGGKGDDRLFGNDGEDLLQGDEGNDALDGGSGHDTLRGGDGDDRLFGRDGDDSLEGGAGSDSLEGGAGQDRLHGGDGNDTLAGGDGDDQLFGEAGADTLRGDDGSDRLDGGTGADRLEGGRGEDVLTGGDGSDTFVFGREAGHDWITDFRPEDVIEFHDGVFTSFSAVLARATQAGADTVIDDGMGDVLILQGVSRSSLQDDEFKFA